MTDPVNQFTVADSGERATFGSGMVRDSAAGKIRPDLVKDGPMYLRWVALMTRGAVKYAARNWMKAAGQEEYDRFLESTDRHYMIWYMWRRFGLNYEQWPDGPVTRDPLTEDHGAATYFGINGVEYVAEQRETEKPTSPPGSVDWPNSAGEWKYEIGVEWSDPYNWTDQRDARGEAILQDRRGRFLFHTYNALQQNERKKGKVSALHLGGQACNWRKVAA